MAVLWVLLRRLRVGRAAAAAATLGLATGATFWAQCLAAEVHALNALLLVGALLCLARVADAPPTRAAPA